MKVEILVEFKHGTETYFPGEVVITDDNVCEYWCRAGWAKDVDGIVPTGSPSLSDTILFVENITENQESINVGV